MKGVEAVSDGQIQPRLTIVPTLGIDPLDALATSMYASPGLYAVLLGAGMSLSAGQPSAWEILRSLIKEIAKSSDYDLDGSKELPEDWWKEKTGEEPLYGTVLQHLAPTPGARQQVLQKYFKPSEDWQQPEISPAHEHLSELCAAGKIKVVLTTNFDRLTEQALSAKGVNFQLIQPKNISGMIPLVHAPVTVIKLHGDYQSIDIRNTHEELSEYPRSLRSKLQEIFRDFGLIVVGWSGEWDTALRNLIQRNESRIYPMYWVAHNGDMTEPAARLVSNRNAFQITSSGADEFFSDLSLRVNRLAQVAQRKQRPSFLRSDRFSPYMFIQNIQLPDNPPPNLLLRTAVTLGPATTNDSDVISLAERRKILAAINNHHFSNQLRLLALNDPRLKSAAPRWNETLFRWDLSQTDGIPSGDSIAFRLNLDPNEPSMKVFARLIVNSPANLVLGNNFLALIDVGLEVSRKLALNEVATILLGSLDILTNVIPEALANITPPDTVPNQAELHIARPEQRDGTGSHPNDLDQFIDLSPWGPPPARSPGGGLDRLTTAVQLHGPLAPRDAIDLVVRAVERMALNAGYGDYENSTAQLRDEMLANLDG